MSDKERKPDLQSELGMTRRDLIRRGAIVGGTLLWAAPVIQSIRTPAFAGSPGCHTCCCCNTAVQVAPGVTIRCIEDNFTVQECANFCSGGGGVHDYCSASVSAAGNAGTGDCTCVGNRCVAQ